MEPINYQEEYKKLFSDYRANSGEPDEAALSSMEALLDKFPFCQPLHFIYTAGLRRHTEKFEDHLFKISIRMPERENLYQIIHHPEKLNFKINISPEVAGKSGNLTAERSDTIVDTVNSDLPAGESHEPVPEATSKESSEFTKDIPSEWQVSQDNTRRESEKSSDEPLFMDNADLTDYFTLDKSAADQLDQSEDAGSDQDIKSLKSSAHKVSKYNDDKMPYTFLWWLNKTRKEYTDTYQPYANFKPDTSRPAGKNINDELNRQIIENIFHLQVPVSDKSQKIKGEANTIEFELKKKEDNIIERFIKEEPQIRPMQGEKIDTENKAKKSAEDANEIVSETLAKVYIEQMLFDKALATYKKLSLKFPKKNAYFADQISKLEKKINQ